MSPLLLQTTKDWDQIQAPYAGGQVVYQHYDRVCVGELHWVKIRNGHAEIVVNWFIDSRKIDVDLDGEVIWDLPQIGRAVLLRYDASQYPAMIDHEIVVDLRELGTIRLYRRDAVDAPYDPAALLGDVAA